MEREKIIEKLNAGNFNFSLHCSDGKIYSTRTDGKMPLHKHSFREMLFVVAGKSQFILNGRLHELSDGSVVLIDSWIPHSYGYTESDHNLVHLWFHFCDNELNVHWCNVGFHGQYTFAITMPLPSHVQTLFVSRWNELKKQREITPELKTFYLQSPFRCLLEELVLLMTPKEKTVSDLPDIVHSVRLYIESQNARDCSLEHLEKIFGYNRFYLSHRFREVMGFSVGTYINQVRLAFTGNAIAKGFKQKEIAYELGFSSSAAFWKWYQKNKK